MKKSGFTLIELVVVFSVIGFLSALGIASFVNYSRTQSVQTSYLDILTTLNLAKANSFNQVKPTQCESSNFNLDGYEFDPNTIDGTYTLYAICESTKFSVKEGALPPNISFGSGTSTSIIFPVLTSKTTGGTVIIQGYNLSKTITVDSLGLVKGVDTFSQSPSSPTPTPTPTPTSTPTPTPLGASSSPTPTAAPSATPSVCTNGSVACVNNTISYCLNNTYYPFLPQCRTGTVCNSVTYSCDVVGGGGTGSLCGGRVCTRTCRSFFGLFLCI